MKAGFLYKKATQALNYFAIKEGGTLNRMKALKLIWLADRYQLRKYGKLIFNDTYFALKNGTVASATKDLAYNASQFLEDAENSYNKKFIATAGDYDFKSINPTEIDVFSKSEINALELIYANFGHLDQFQLSDLSHDYPEWEKYKTDFTSMQSSSRFEIDYQDFFKNPTKNNHKIFMETDTFINSSREFFKNC